MSDQPPAPPPPPPTIPAGWYPDPAQPGSTRWWDGASWGQQRPALIMTTMNDLPGHKVGQVLGVAVGLVANSMGIGRSIGAQFQSMAKGEVPQWTEALEAGRLAALHRLEEHARAMGANAVIALRIDASELAQGLVEFVAYGTAAVVTPIDPA